MVDSLTSVIDQIRNRNETSFIEIVTKATCHDRSVAIVKSFTQEFLAVLLKLLSFHEICNQLNLQLQTL